MTRDYKTLSEINPATFRSLITDTSDPLAQDIAPAGLMSSRFSQRITPTPVQPVGLDQQSSAPVENPLLTTIARLIGRNADNKERVAEAVTTNNMGQSPAGIEGYESLQPIDKVLHASEGDQTRDALGTVDPFSMPDREGTTRGPEPTGDAITELLDFISTGEGDYDSYNSGTINDVIQHSSHNYMQGGTALSGMTIGQIREQMNIEDARNPDRIFAAGRYQVIPSTLESAVEALNLSDDTVFNRETQDQIGLYLVSEKRPLVGRYISGGDVSTNRAMLDLAMEFASFPVPYAIEAGAYGRYPERNIQAGESFYASSDSRPGTNRASHSVQETRELLERLRGN